MPRELKITEMALMRLEAVQFATEGIADTDMEATASFVFIWPNFGYMAVGVLVALCGIGIGSLMRLKKR